MLTFLWPGRLFTLRPHSLFCRHCLFNVHYFTAHNQASAPQGDQHKRERRTHVLLPFYMRRFYFLVTFVSSPRLSLLPVFFLIAKRSTTAVVEGITRKRNNGCRGEREKEVAKVCLSVGACLILANIVLLKRIMLLRWIFLVSLDLISVS